MTGVPAGSEWSNRVRRGLVRSAMVHPAGGGPPTPAHDLWDDAAMADDGLVVLITGATGALGRAAAQAFAADGARLGLLGTSEDRLRSLAAASGLDDGRWAPGVGDLRDATQAGSAIDAVTSVLGPPDVLLHLVGGWTGGTTLPDLEPGVLDDMLGQHVWSTFHVVRAVTPGMVERGWGRVIAVTSTLAASPGPGMAPYVAAKAGQEGLVRVLARELAGSGVTANLLAVKTIDAEHERERAPSKKNASWTTPEEIVEAMRFLCTDAAAPVNGQVLRLDGR